ncbi:uncharacterized protein B0H64DRAFT_165073 [Chaetomium fimeti]|uniref:Uncharacterized protein n=1 Tax=Chaetomium fimeti TaxID=1854472 RepID=A0AAE0HIE9_9PEZI|nr:hypothetical protein B0H64DRAFT_165073 [Chaetomium fimeti]
MFLCSRCQDAVFDLLSGSSAERDPGRSLQTLMFGEEKSERGGELGSEPAAPQPFQWITGERLASRECFRMVELWGNIPVILVHLSLAGLFSSLSTHPVAGVAGFELLKGEGGPETAEGERKRGLGSPATAHAGNIQQACGTKHRRPWEQEKKVGRNSMDGANRLSMRCWQAQRGDIRSLTGRLAIADGAACQPPLPPLGSRRGGKQETEDAAGLTHTHRIHPALECIQSPQPPSCMRFACTKQGKVGPLLCFSAAEASHRSVIPGQSLCPTGKCGGPFPCLRFALRHARAPGGRPLPNWTSWQGDAEGDRVVLVCKPAGMPGVIV